MNSTAATDLIFRWEPTRSRRLSILGFLGASLALHAFCFYLFQIVYAPTVSLLPPPAHVNVISPSTEEGRVLLRWIEAEDPLLASTTLRPRARRVELPPVPYHPSYLTSAPALKELPRTETQLRMPSARKPGPVPTQAPPKSTPPPRIATTVDFADGEIAGAVQKPAAQFSASNNVAPENARFRLGVNDRGEARYCFRQESSGDEALDEQARAFLMRCRFSPQANSGPPDETHLRWTTATVIWGNDVAAPTPPTSRSTAP